MAVGPTYRVVRDGGDPRTPALDSMLEDGRAVVAVDDCVRVIGRDGGRQSIHQLDGHVHRACVARGAGVVAMNLNRETFAPEGIAGIGPYFASRFGAKLFDVESNSARLIESIPMRHETDLAISPDGQRLVTFRPEQAIWAVPDGERLATLEGSGLSLNASAFDPSGERIAALFDGNPNPFAELNDSTPWKSELRLWRTDGTMVFARQRPYISIEYLGFSDDGAAIVGLDADREPVAAWDATTGESRSTGAAPRIVEPGAGPRLRRYRAEKRDVRLVVSDDDKVTIANAEAPPGTAMLTGDDIHYPFALSRAGDTAAALAWPSRANAQPDVIRWEAPTLRRLSPLAAPNPAAPLSSLALSPDGRWVAAGGADWLVCVWNQATGELRATLRGHEATVHGVAFAPDGCTLYSASRDGVVLAWTGFAS